MSLQELWELFPISLVEHNDRWEEYYQEIAGVLRKVLAAYPVVRISHIGSTALPGIRAKNIVDVLVEVEKTADLHEIIQTMEENGFLCMSSSAKRVSFNRGYSIHGFEEKVYHIHLRYAGDNDELYFRDYLREHPVVAGEYEALKLRLWKQYEHDRDAYTRGKSDFVRKWTMEGRRRKHPDSGEVIS